MRGHAATHPFALPRHLGAQSRDRTAIRPVGSGPLRQVVGYEIVQIREPALSLGAPLECTRHRLGGKIVLRSEMTVEAAMREAGTSHDRIDARTVEAFLTKHPCSGVHDPPAALGRLLSADAHFPPLAVTHPPLTEYMTHIMNIGKMTNVIYKPKLNRASTYQHEELVMTDLPYRTALIVGAGSGISASVARRLAAAGLSVGLAARDVEKVAALAAPTPAPTFAVVATGPSPVAPLFDEAGPAL